MKKLLTIVLIGTFLTFSTITAFAESFQGVNYTIIEKTNLESIKYSVDNRLSKKVSENFLQLLALKIHKEEPRKYDRMFITNTVRHVYCFSRLWIDCKVLDYVVVEGFQQIILYCNKPMNAYSPIFF